jgi:hypothetical protein
MIILEPLQSSRNEEKRRLMSGDAVDLVTIFTVYGKAFDYSSYIGIRASI